jgi:hypothetical protein
MLVLVVVVGEDGQLVFESHTNHSYVYYLYKYYYYYYY